MPDFASLTDGLVAEREQGITIDVAYRYFNTPKRKFIIADTPGHEQYTRNMVTGASTADAAIVLIDASKLDLSQDTVQLLTQTKRHSAILKLLATPSIAIAINKLDLLDFDETAYQKIVAAYQKIANQLQLNANLHYVPISALSGDNIVNSSHRTPWFDGLALLPWLENLPSSFQVNPTQFAHFPVQRVIRQDGSSRDDFRGYQGRLESGSLNVGDAVKILPNGKTAHIQAIYKNGLELQQAQTADVLTLVLDTHIDISRGDAIVSIDNPMISSKNIQAAICWLDDLPLNTNRRYVLKHATQSTLAKVTDIACVWDINHLLPKPEITGLYSNDIAVLNLNVQQAIHASSYQDNPATGAFILIDEANNRTVAAGMIRANTEKAILQI